ncbi:MAG: RidA family protein [Treponema sp.]|jgi:enamine deaminase RidA (YjgF/YER057c/UK114 family)|nr:RidA family protein [Treponema sp.]
MEMKSINPQTLAQPRGYSQMVTVSGAHKTIYIGGQDAIDADGELVGAGDLGKQTEQVLTNIENALIAINCTFENVVKMTIYVVEGNDPRIGFAAFQKKFGWLQKLPVITVVFVAGLGSPHWLVEIDAVAVADE